MLSASLFALKLAPNRVVRIAGQKDDIFYGKTQCRALFGQVLGRGKILEGLKVRMGLDDGDGRVAMTLPRKNTEKASVVVDRARVDIGGPI